MDEDEYFFDEKGGEGGDWHWPGGPSTGGWGGGGGGGGGGGNWEGEKEQFDPVAEPLRLNRTLTNYMLADKDGLLLSCKQGCSTIPSLVGYITGENTFGHAQCVLVKTTGPARPAATSHWAGFDGTVNTPAMTAHWYYGQPGTYRVRVKWQAGHYDYSKIKRAKFYIYGVSTGWLTMALKSWTTVATVTVGADYRLTVNGVPGTRAGNLQLLES